MPAPEEDVAQLFHDAYTVLVERAPEAPAFDEITSRSAGTPTNGWRFDGAPTQDDLGVFDLGQQDDSAQPALSKRVTAGGFAMAAVILLVIGIVVAVRNEDSVVTDAASTPSTAEPTAPAVVPGTPLWPLLSFEDGAGFLGVVAADPGFVAVGESGGNAAVWTSVDGLTWSPVPHDEAVFGGEGTWAMGYVTRGGPG